MKKILAVILSIAVVLCLFGCAKDNTETTAADDTNTATLDEIVIAVPNDATNEARALLLLEALGYISLKEDAGITATKLDILENPYNIKIEEIEAAGLPNMLPDVDFAVINSNYALTSGINPSEKALGQEDAASEAANTYANIIAVKEGNEETPAVKALVAAVESEKVKDFIAATYNNAVVSTIANPTDGYAADVNYDELAGTTITIAASPTPHAEILGVVKEILAEKEITLDIREFDDYILPNEAVESGEVDANYFQHLPYLEDYNDKNDSHIVSVSAVHFEPLGIYGGKQTSLDVIGASNEK